jgi:maltose alpha-D-glucosyltransferase / alpha-amylase
MEAALARYLGTQRWFGGKARTIHAVRVLDAIPIPLGHVVTEVTLVRTEYADGDPETYVLPLALGREGDPSWGQIPQRAVVARVTADGGEGWLYDPAFDSAFGKALLDTIWGRRRHQGGSGEIVGAPARSISDANPGTGANSGGDADLGIGASANGQAATFEQSNTSIVFGREMIFKLFRRIQDGINPDVEIGRFLTDAGFANTPAFLGTLEYWPTHGEPISLGILQRFVPSEGDAWAYTLGALSGYFARALGHQNEGALPVPPREVLACRDLAEAPPLVCELIGPYLESARLLGIRTADMHAALASAADPAFTPEPFTANDGRALHQSIRMQILESLGLLRQHVDLDHLSADVAALATELLAHEAALLARLDILIRQRFSAVRIRSHGDYHLGQVLFTGNDFMIIDFEGEPARPVSERRGKRSPLRDVAGMLRSFAYAAHVAMKNLPERDSTSGQDAAHVTMLAQYWNDWVSAAFLHGYLGRVEGTPAWPAAPTQLQDLLDVHVLEKAVYELGYELNTRPQWVGIPIAGLLQLAMPGPNPPARTPTAGSQTTPLT